MSGPNYAAECGIKCSDPLFQRFLHDATKMRVADKDEAGAAVRLLCKVQSRREFNETEAGAAAWLRAKRLFGLWRAGHGTNAAGWRHGPSIMGRVAFARGTPISDNPFERPEIMEADETPYDLWELGWRKAERQHRENQERTSNS
jgi:hypothetical protein